MALLIGVNELQGNYFRERKRRRKSLGESQALDFFMKSPDSAFVCRLREYDRKECSDAKEFKPCLGDKQEEKKN